MERDPQIKIERNPARRGPVEVRPATAMGPGVGVAPLAVRNAGRVEWGPIWAGFFIAMLGMAVLGSSATAIGLAAVEPGATTVTPGVTALLIMLASMLLGGWATGYLMESGVKAWGALNGVVLSGVVLTLTLLLSASTALSADRVLGTSIGSLLRNPVTNPAGAATAAGWFTVVALLAVGAAACGGYFGVKQDVEQVVTTRHSEL